MACGANASDMPRRGAERICGIGPAQRLDAVKRRPPAWAICESASVMRIRRIQPKSAGAVARLWVSPFEIQLCVVREPIVVELAHGLDAHNPRIDRVLVLVHVRDELSSRRRRRFATRCSLHHME